MTSDHNPGRPGPSEYAPYYERYISLVPDGDILLRLQSQLESSEEFLRATPEERGDFAYADGKWTLKEVVGHLADTERIFAYRILRISRRDTTPIEGFEQDDYVRYGPFRSLKLGSLAEDLAVVRRSTLRLLSNLDKDAWLLRGVANRNEISVRALAYTIAGHELHHMAMLKERYLV